jgi:hypothetical protein
MSCEEPYDQSLNFSLHNLKLQLAIKKSMIGLIFLNDF